MVGPISFDDLAQPRRAKALSHMGGRGRNGNKDLGPHLEWDIIQGSNEDEVPLVRIRGKGCLIES